MEATEVLFSPIKVGGVELKNRLVMAPMTTGYAHPDGVVSDRLRCYYEAAARGGVSLVIVEAALVHPSGQGWENQVGCYHDRYVAGLAALAQGIKAHGARAFLQVVHCGRRATRDLVSGELIAPSPIPVPGSAHTPREMSAAEIQEIGQAFAQAVRRAKEAGYDGVELHGAHGYLIGQFLSPFSNHRRDAYGGDTWGRARFLREIIQRARQLVGPDYPLGCRLSVDELVPGGLEAAESQTIARILEKERVAYLHASAGALGSRTPAIRLTMGCGEATLAHLAQALKAAVASTPVIAVGRILTPQTAAEIVRTRKADLVALGRALLADPHFPRKAQEGRSHDIRRCIGCNACQLRTTRPGIGCLVNLEVGHEYDLKLEPTPAPKRVAVLGGGWAGLEAARVAAQRGHQVQVCLGDTPLGGLLACRAAVPGNEEFQGAIAYRARELAQAGAKITTEAPSSAEAWAEAVVLARPGRPLLPQMAGLDAGTLLTAEEVLWGQANLSALGPRVAVLGDGVVAAETALFLAQYGKQVTLLAEAAKPFVDAHPGILVHVFERLKPFQPTLLTAVRIERWEKGSLVVTRDGAEERLGPFDALVAGLGWQEDSEEPSRGTQREIYALGDAYDAYSAWRLAYQGTLVGRRI